VRLNKKMFQFEGMQLAKQLHQNITIFNNYRTGNDGDVNLSTSLMQPEPQPKKEPLTAREPAKAPPSHMSPIK
jgi:hypothetical protein